MNRYVVAPLVAYNFGPDAKVRVETSGVRNRNAALLRDILFKVIDAENSGVASSSAAIVDSVKLLEELNVPHK